MNTEESHEDNEGHLKGSPELAVPNLYKGEKLSYSEKEGDCE